MFRFYIVSEKYGLVAVADEQERGERLALIAAVNSARTVHLHDRCTEEKV